MFWPAEFVGPKPSPTLFAKTPPIRIAPSLPRAPFRGLPLLFFVPPSSRPRGSAAPALALSSSISPLIRHERPAIRMVAERWARRSIMALAMTGFRMSKATECYSSGSVFEPCDAEGIGYLPFRQPFVVQADYRRPVHITNNLWQPPIQWT